MNRRNELWDEETKSVMKEFVSMDMPGEEGEETDITLWVDWMVVLMVDPMDA